MYWSYCVFSLTNFRFGYVSHQVFRGGDRRDNGGHGHLRPRLELVLLGWMWSVAHVRGRPQNMTASASHSACRLSILLLKSMASFRLETYLLFKNQPKEHHICRKCIWNIKRNYTLNIYIVFPPTCYIWCWCFEAGRLVNSISVWKNNAFKTFYRSEIFAQTLVIPAINC